MVLSRFAVIAQAEVVIAVGCRAGAKGAGGRGEGAMRGREHGIDSGLRVAGPPAMRAASPPQPSHGPTQPRRCEILAHAEG